jgi:hypothetical protein
MNKLKIETKVHTVWFRYGDNEKDFYYITLPENCENPLSDVKKLDSRIYKIED